MTKVTAEQVTSSTVNAACQCASQITQLLRLHLDAQRLHLQQAKRPRDDG
jgi:hypothetical protein